MCLALLITCRPASNSEHSWERAGQLLYCPSWLISRSHVPPLSPHSLLTKICPGSRASSMDPGSQPRHIPVKLSLEHVAWGTDWCWAWPSGKSGASVPVMHSSTVSRGPFSCRAFASSCWVPWVISMSSSLCTFQNLSGVCLLARCPFPLWPLFLTLVGFEEEGTVILCHQCTFNLMASFALFLLIFIFYPLSLLVLLGVCEFC